MTILIITELGKRIGTLSNECDHATTAVKALEENLGKAQEQNCQLKADLTIERAMFSSLHKSRKTVWEQLQLISAENKEPGSRSK